MQVDDNKENRPGEHVEALSKMHYAENIDLPVSKNFNEVQTLLSTENSEITVYYVLIVYLWLAVVQ